MAAVGLLQGSVQVHAIAYDTFRPSPQTSPATPQVGMAFPAPPLVAVLAASPAQCDILPGLDKA